MKNNLTNLEKAKTPMEPFMPNNFEVIFPVCDNVLKESVISIKPGMICFSLNVIDNTLVPLHELLALSEQSGDIIVKTHDKEGNVFMQIIYSECRVNLNLNEILSFSYYEKNSPFGINFSSPINISATFEFKTVTLQTINGDFNVTEKFNGWKHRN